VCVREREKEREFAGGNNGTVWNGRRSHGYTWTNEREALNS
jgi:hypothetical protein